MLMNTSAPGIGRPESSRTIPVRVLAGSGSAATVSATMSHKHDMALSPAGVPCDDPECPAMPLKFEAPVYEPAMEITAFGKLIGGPSYGSKTAMDFESPSKRSMVRRRFISGAFGKVGGCLGTSVRRADPTGGRVVKPGGSPLRSM